jgi:hypothetical protein
MGIQQHIKKSVNIYVYIYVPQIFHIHLISNLKFQSFHPYWIIFVFIPSLCLSTSSHLIISTTHCIGIVSSDHITSHHITLHLVSYSSTDILYILIYCIQRHSGSVFFYSYPYSSPLQFSCLLFVSLC